nr:MAG TPA: hypothetical protein [Caudoviricetes sp.]
MKPAIAFTVLSPALSLVEGRGLHRRKTTGGKAWERSRQQGRRRCAWRLRTCRQYASTS